MHVEQDLKICQARKSLKSNTNQTVVLRYSIFLLSSIIQHITQHYHFAENIYFSIKIQLKRTIVCFLAYLNLHLNITKNSSGRNTFCLNVTPFPLSSFLNVHIWTCKKVCNNFCFCRPLSQNFLKSGTIHFSIMKQVTFFFFFKIMPIHMYKCSTLV